MSRHAVAIGDRHHEGAQTTELLLEETDRRRVLGAPEAVRADELGELIALMGLGARDRPHLDELDRYPAPRELPGRLAAREAAPDDRDRWSHAESLAVARTAGKSGEA